MSEYWDAHRMVRGSGGPEYEPAPPGLLISLGDSRAREVTAEMLAEELRKISFVPGMRTVEDLAETLAPRIIAALIQKAQEPGNV